MSGTQMDKLVGTRFIKTMKFSTISTEKMNYNIIYNLLREFCHKYNAKWYNLRENNYDNVKHYLLKKFSSF